MDLCSLDNSLCSLVHGYLIKNVVSRFTGSVSGKRVVMEWPSGQISVLAMASQ